jgi:WD40 repeat protein
MTFSGKGRVHMAATDQTVKVWDLTTGGEILTRKGKEGPVHSVAVSSTGKRIVSGSGDGKVREWEPGF